MKKGGRAMGLDVGERRIGVAIADELDTIASPLTTVERHSDDLVKIRELARARSVDRLIVGMPTGMSGREGPQAASVRAFVDELRLALLDEFRIEYWDERLTTAVAERAMRGRRTRERRRGDIDAMAAAIILQGYLDANRARSRPGSPPNSVDAM